MHRSEFLSFSPLFFPPLCNSLLFLSMEKPRASLQYPVTLSLPNLLQANPISPMFLKCFSSIVLLRRLLMLILILLLILLIYRINCSRFHYINGFIFIDTTPSPSISFIFHFHTFPTNIFILDPLRFSDNLIREHNLEIGK